VILIAMIMAFILVLKIFLKNKVSLSGSESMGQG
jgi:hypothetical protein